MNKKAYIAPTMEATDIETAEMIATSNGTFNISDETTEDDANMTNKRRGSWGNLWE